MKKIWTIVVTVIAGIFAIFISKKRSSKKQKNEEPPKNIVSDVAEGSVQETFEENVDRIKSATTGNSPADDLADLGNSRRR
tara:strand:+ start:1171 stop:1413 length:243 start_codon:yes stop_codon:yes gene_type:complete